MVVVGVVAILALMAMPNYSDRIIRDQIVEALPLADIAKPPVAVAWATSQAFPANNTGAGLPASEKIVNNYIRLKSLNKTDIPANYLPLRCRAS